jgi:nicotinate-nucleotide adenylyltransferase
MNAEILRLGILGGMFDPVHAGHLNAARAARASCRLDRVLLLPCGVPVHRTAARVSSEHRIAMLQLLADEEPWLTVDARECASTRVSRTWETVTAIQADFPGSLLFLVIGMDSLLSLSGWYRWQSLLDKVNIVVVSRPGYPLDYAGMDAALKQEIGNRLVPAAQAPALEKAGYIIVLDDQQVAASSTSLRAGLSQQQAQDAVMPLHPAVQQYIARHGLYLGAE